MSERFEHHARTVTVLTFLSRITGLLRDASLARIFGNGALMDAFGFAFMIPNLFRRLFGEGALSAAFLPVYTQLDKTQPAVGKQLATLTLGLMFIMLGGLTVLGELVLWIALSLGVSKDALAIHLTMIMLPYMPLVCLVAIFGAMLQVHGRFGPTASAPAVLNLFLVAAAWGGYQLLRKPHEIAQTMPASAPDLDSSPAAITHLHWVAWVVIVAGFVQVLWSMWSLRTTPWYAGALARCREAGPHMKRVLSQAWPMFIGLGVLQVNTFIDGIVASYPTTFGPHFFGWEYPLSSGALASLNNAQRLYEFPLGVFGIAVATAIFPALAKLTNDVHGFSDTLRRGLRLVIYIGLPASAGLILVRSQLVAAVFQGKNFTADDTDRVAFVLLGYAPAIWAYSMTHVLTRAFYAKGDSFAPVRVAVSMVFLNFALNVSLIWTPLHEAGLAWSTAFCAIIQSFILLRMVRRRYADHAIVDRDVRLSWLRTVMATLVMSAAVIAAQIFLLPMLRLTPAHALTWRLAVLQLAFLVAVGGLAYASASKALKMPEMWWAVGRRT
ncbi:MAG TPA: murein biosynthesis integral membrane protein MurJ [Phycisphaerales bacterium]|nr:murein biosynthesis integral membrane protein MurJ [Phycisphaerales bacterium]